MLEMMNVTPVMPLNARPGDGDETGLLVRLRQGEEAAFQELVRGQGGRMLAVARRLLGNEDDAQEAVQDAFLSALRAIGDFDGKSQIGTWLHRIVVNAALMKLRKSKRKLEQSIEPLLPIYYEDGHRQQPTGPWQVSSDHLLENRESCALIRRCIDQLPQPYRTVLWLRDIEELDTEETARQLDLTIGVVKTRLHRARQALRGLLDPYYRVEAV